MFIAALGALLAALSAVVDPLSAALGLSGRLCASQYRSWDEVGRSWRPPLVLLDNLAIINKSVQPFRISVPCCAAPALGPQLRCRLLPPRRRADLLMDGVSR